MGSILPIPSERINSNGYEKQSNSVSLDRAFNRNSDKPDGLRLHEPLIVVDDDSITDFPHTFFIRTTDGRKWRLG